MKLNKIKISGIFNLKDVEISLDDLSALIAPNNYGKSNVLRAIDFGVFFMEASLKRKLSLMRNRSLIPINTALEGTPFSFELEGEFSNGEKTFSFVYGYSFEWGKTSKDDGARIIGEYLRMKSDDDLKFRSYINREDTNVAYYLASPTGRCSKQLLVDNNILALNKLANFDDLFYIDSIRQLNRLDVREIGTLQHPDSLFNMIAPDDDVNELSLDYPRESKVGYYLNSLKKLAPNKYELLKDVVTGLLVTIEDYNNQYTSISRISSGSKKIFFILTLVIAAEINKIPLLLLEELENSVHPRLLQNLLTAIVQLAGDTKVLITSHSPYLIKYLEPTKMKFGIPTELGVADFRSLKPNKVAKVLKNASAEEVSVGEYMFEMLLDMDCNDELINEYFK